MKTPHTLYRQTVGMAVSLVLVAGVFGQVSALAGFGPALKPTVRKLEISNKPWTGDFDGLIERRVIRVLSPYSRSLYFNDRGRQWETPAVCRKS